LKEDASLSEVDVGHEVLSRVLYHTD